MTLAISANGEETTVDPTTQQSGAVPAAVLLGAGIRTAELVWRAARPLRLVVKGAAGAAVGALVPASLAERLEERGRAGWVEVDRWVEATLRYAIGRVVAALLATTDITALVREHVDIDGLAAGLDVDAVVARVDFDAALAHIDIVRIAREVIDALELPEIIRQSTGTLTSDTVRSVRSEAMHADDIVAGVVDRLLRRSRGRTATP